MRGCAAPIIAEGGLGFISAADGGAPSLDVMNSTNSLNIMVTDSSAMGTSLVSGVGQISNYAVVDIVSARTMQRFASSTLKPFSLAGRASFSASSAARRKVAALTEFPFKARSASRDRHGRVPTPPRAT